MSELLGEFENKVYLSDKELFTKIWTSPRLVFKYINDNYYTKYMALLLSLAGLSTAFERSIGRNSSNAAYQVGALIGYVIAGILIAWFFYYMISALLMLTGKWLKGKGNTKSILNILAYAALPKILALIFIIPQIATSGMRVFSPDGGYNNTNVLGYAILLGTGIIQVGLGIWSVVLSIIGLSEVQKFSIGKAIINLLLASVIIIIPLVIIALIPLLASK